MKKSIRLASILLSVAMLAGVMTGCGKTTDDTSTSSKGSVSTADNTAQNPKKPDTSKEAKLIYYFWGSAGVQNEAILKEINTKMKADINATIEAKYIDWGDVATKYPLLFSSGEQFDLSEASPSFAVSYFTLAKQDALADLTGLLDSVPALKKEIPEKAWDYTKVNDKVYGVPTLYVAFNSYGLVTRSDISKKGNVAEVNSVETAEAYFDAALKQGMVPLNGNSAMGVNNYRLFLNLTDTWFPEVPGIVSGELGLAAKSATEYKDIFHPAFTQEFVDYAVKMREWADKGYWGKDVLSAPKTDKDNFIAGSSGAYITHQPDWTGSYSAIKTKLPDVETEFWCFGENNGKIKRMPPTENITAISSTSKNPERALMAIEKFMTDESYYRLLQNGIEGKQYAIVDGFIQEPDGFVSETDGGGFTAWAPRNNRFNLPVRSEDPRRAILNAEWDKIAIDDPYIGFAFDPKKVSTELAAVSNVNSTIGTQIMLGKSVAEPKAAVEEYRAKLTQAGIEKIVAEVKAQLDAFTPNK